MLNVKSNDLLILLDENVDDDDDSVDSNSNDVYWSAQVREGEKEIKAAV